MVQYRVTPVEPRDGQDLIALFERDASPCYCRYWHFEGTNKEWEARCAFDAAANRGEFESELARGSVQAQGLIARIPGSSTVVGWMKLAARNCLHKLLARAPYKGLDEPDPSDIKSHANVETHGARADPRPVLSPAVLSPAVLSPAVLSIACFLIDPAHRKTGVATALVEGAIDWGTRWGARFLEAYPRVPTEPVHDAELWMGPASVFSRAGFVVVRDSHQYPVLRRPLDVSPRIESHG